MSLSARAPTHNIEMQTLLKGRRVGYWLSEKKIKKMNFLVFVDMCRKRGIEMVQLDLSRPLEEQGPLDVIIHKLADLILADQNDTQALLLVQSVQDYIDTHPEMVVLDPLPAIRTLLDRCKSYQLIRRLEDCMKDERICSPPFMVLRSECGTDTLKHIQKHGITFPFICKTPNSNSHEMAIIFSEEDLKDVKPPCVIQNFINHDAVLYKVYVVGEAYYVVERPSIRNFPSGPAERKPIFFHSHDVSKPECASDLNSRDNVEGVSRVPIDDVIREISRCLRRELDVSLFGIDIIISNQTGQHAVIDINAFPGYEGVPEFFDDLLSHLTSVLQERAFERTSVVRGQLPAAALADCGKPCMLLGNEANTWIVEGDCVKRGGNQGLGCDSEVSANFQQHCASAIPTKASSQ
ncbi:inositol-tetrakisphosphate 1-kinase isoform X1 [Oncorhynchus keta]|uniref:inositol-tetrakisphosphate 1-kinase isoform X1 n=4 Tax=Oncorhynchus keta TaxID=8018 RepID=UPI0015FB0DC9|nr:inositol-tetrakisphosphate 1-kinase isoform X1 [Oncorhynchus keta]